ncbi:MAG: hypothetical protein JNM49_00635 [Flavobacteriales bacterium]|nr:hypothetical protein [Flavobacteriales bacterium]
MIKRALLVFAALVLGYSLFLRFAGVDWDTTQHLANGNRIKAERFAFDHSADGGTVIIGSSLAYRLVLDSFPVGTANLGFGGLSVYDGLELIRRSGRKPKRVIVETNILFREPDRAFLDALFQPGLYQIRERLPLMREENQPSGVLFGWLKQRLLQGHSPSAVSDSSAGPSAVLLAEHRARYAEVPADSVQVRFVDMLAQGIKAVEGSGAEVVFFEMPIEAELEESKLSARTRALVRERFPAHRFVRADGQGWRTTDGLHLTKPEAARFSGWLAAAIGAH